MPVPSNVTQMLLRWSEGDPDALDQLMPLVYDQLKRLAHARLRHERPGHTLNTTGLVHEAYLKLVDVDQVQWKDRAHFFTLASRVMRNILVDAARRRLAQKRGGGRANVELDEERLVMPEGEAEQLLALDEALHRLEDTYPRPSKVVELYYFGGLTQVEVGQVLEISQPTVMRDLRFARAWLARMCYVDL